MADGGFKIDPSFVQALKDPKQRFIDSMVAKSAREKRRKIIADKKAKRCRAYETNVVSVSPIKEPMVTQTAREKRRQIIAAKRAMRCSTSNAVLSNNVQSSQLTKSKGCKNSGSSGEKHEAREVPWQKPQGDNFPTNAEKK
ncbi:unnamed protein product [Arabis nemorensis]|uniref:Uncharacterized protein n=1 Tax=Arabis nemorensis TaxID=586526 RepID=A0A565AUQ9_9BRAS|nr:unnamed protein product [Arabis nemorensis]